MSDTPTPCVDCGGPIDPGAEAVFTVCDACWNRRAAEAGARVHAKLDPPTPVPGAERLREIASAHRRHATICRWTANEEDAAEHERMADDLRALAAVFAQIPAPAEPTAVGRGDGLGEDFWACAKFVARLRSTLSPEPPDHAD